MSPVALLVLAFIGCVPTDDFGLTRISVANHLSEPAVVVVSGAGLSTARVLTVPANSGPTGAGLYPVDDEPPLDQGRARFYRVDCRSLGQVVFGHGAWVLTLGESGPVVDPLDAPVSGLELLEASPTSCGEFGPRERWSITAVNGDVRDLVARLAFEEKRLDFVLPAGAALVLHVEQKAEPGAFQVLDPATCLVLASSPLLDVSMEVSVSAPLGPGRVFLQSEVVLDPEADPDVADATPSSECS